MCITTSLSIRKGYTRPIGCQSNASSSKDRIAKARCTERSRPKHTRQKSVRFHETIISSTKPHNAPREDMQQTWYGRLEYKNFQKDNKRSLRAVIKSKLVAKKNNSPNIYDTSQHCLRGLEACLSTQLYQQRKDAKMKIVKEVLHEQLLQRILGFSDPENLATVSKGLSQNSQYRALLMAAYDSRAGK